MSYLMKKLNLLFLHPAEEKLATHELLWHLQVTEDERSVTVESQFCCAMPNGLYLTLSRDLLTGKGLVWEMTDWRLTLSAGPGFKFHPVLGRSFAETPTELIETFLISAAVDPLLATVEASRVAEALEKPVQAFRAYAFSPSPSNDFSRKGIAKAKAEQLKAAHAVDELCEKASTWPADAMSFAGAAISFP